ncbi:hypothetical protein Patl1_27244 [Pistacia atlantica]|uniref:Uncharacterized protein n=1 Tax=Pistacia atlantica TaxID=434234 RepID=A0ACC1BDX0_9ROSI|nr:hypothetical protein Patl1_27244 [Pistacia atlantica]
MKTTIWYQNSETSPPNFNGLYCQTSRESQRPQKLTWTIPLVLVSLIFNRIKAYFSIQKILIFIQVYLAIYFSILCLSALVTGLEPLKFFYATSQSTYVCLQVLQTLGYVLYLVAASDVFDSRIFDRLWAGLEDVGPGPNVCGLCGWASLLRGGVSIGWCFINRPRRIGRFMGFMPRVSL